MIRKMKENIPRHEYCGNTVVIFKKGMGKRVFPGTFTVENTLGKINKIFKIMDPATGYHVFFMGKAQALH